MTEAMARQLACDILDNLVSYPLRRKALHYKTDVEYLTQRLMMLVLENREEGKS